VAADTPRVRLESDLLTGALVELWSVLLDLSERLSDAWSLIGGQMVLLHGLENGRTPPAASTDLDVLADIQADQQSLQRLVAVLTEMGFTPAGMSPQGNLMHRYQRGHVPGLLKVDVLAADHLGPRANLMTTPPGRTIEVPGGRQAIQRTETVRVELGERTGIVRRPSLLGAIVGKAAALSIKTSSPDKHYRDLAFLLSLADSPLQLKAELTPSDRTHLARASALHDSTHRAWRQLEDDEAQADGQATYRILHSPR
jgi:hypothetical protein